MAVYSYSAASCLCNCTSPSKGNSKESGILIDTCSANMQPKKFQLRYEKCYKYIVGVVFCCLLVAIRTFYSNQLYKLSGQNL